MRTNLFKSAGYWTVALVVGFSAEKQSKSNNARQNNYNVTLWLVFQYKKELNYTKLQA